MPKQTILRPGVPGRETHPSIIRRAFDPPERIDIADSRDLRPIVPGRDVAAAVPVATEYIKACPTFTDSDINEGRGFVLLSGQTGNLPFTYRVGNPAATAITLHFFASPMDSLTLKNPIIEGQPAAMVFPQIPAPDPTGVVEQNGYVRIVAPPVGDNETQYYYGAIVLHQPDPPGDM